LRFSQCSSAGASPCRMQHNMAVSLNDTCLPVAAHLKPLLPLLPGAAHSISLITFGHPFDTMKTRLQLGMHPNLWACFKHARQNGGILTLYRGAAMPLLQLLMKRPFEFYAFEWINRRFKGVPGSSFGGGCVAGMLAAVLGCPFSVVKIQMQAKERATYPTNTRAILAVWRASGFSGFYRGLKASMITKVPFSTVYLGTYGALRDRLPKTAWNPAVSGAAASLLTWSLLQPLDTMQTIIQSTAADSKSADSRGWIAQFRSVFANGGARALWAGWTPVALRALPSSAVAMLCYEWTRARVAEVS